ncbi:hypothetical protein Y033_5657 [Burkholderia pseudomallei MSHR435]|nr:hypothetical protein Y033_5657 [Burkholderia pseudomallei MSHR435]
MPTRGRHMIDARSTHHRHTGRPLRCAAQPCLPARRERVCAARTRCAPPRAAAAQYRRPTADARAIDLSPVETAADPVYRVRLLTRGSCNALGQTIVRSG